MSYKVQYILSSNPSLKKYLREHSNYYKNLIRNPDFLNELIKLMKQDYKLTLPAKLDKLKDDISMINTIMDVLN